MGGLLNHHAIPSYRFRHSHLSRLLITQRFLHFSRNDDTG